MDAGMAGGIAGGVIGLMGGVLGTTVSIVNAKGRRERNLTIRFAALIWLASVLMGVWAWLTPSPWRQLTVLWTIPFTLSIPRINRRLAQAQLEDQAEGH